MMRPAGLLLFILFASCTKQQGKNTTLAYTDAALYDSCAHANQNYYYKNDPATLLSGATGPHGTFKLRFNAVAAKALTDNGKLPVGSVMPEGSLIIKDVYKNGSLSLYAFMYKRSGVWLWAEIQANKSVQHGVGQSAAVCTSCHNQAGNRDLTLSFTIY